MLNQQKLNNNTLRKKKSDSGKSKSSKKKHLNLTLETWNSKVMKNKQQVGFPKQSLPWNLHKIS